MLATLKRATAGDDEARTYLYLRVGMVLVIAFLAIAIAIERTSESCWERSISDYWHTPARPAFVGALVAIGACLVIIKGTPAAQDVLLNIAGMLAPLVAFVPTDGPA